MPFLPPDQQCQKTEMNLKLKITHVLDPLTESYGKTLHPWAIIVPSQYLSELYENCKDSFEKLLASSLPVNHRHRQRQRHRHSSPTLATVTDTVTTTVTINTTTSIITVMTLYS